MRLALLLTWALAWGLSIYGMDVRQPLLVLGGTLGMSAAAWVFQRGKC